jgi:maltose O-acetyltransferase
MIIGDRFRLVSTIARCEIFAGPQGTISIGDRVYINYGCSISAQDQIQIGSHVTVGTYCMVIDNDFHSIEPSRRNELPPSIPIILEDNVWLGARVIILKGVTIGRDSVIGAGSVVTRDVPPGCVAAGSPARVIRYVEALPV